MDISICSRLSELTRKFRITRIMSKGVGFDFCFVVKLEFSIIILVIQENDNLHLFFPFCR